jgi:hypothetical protein
MEAYRIQHYNVSQQFKSTLIKIGTNERTKLNVNMFQTKHKEISELNSNQIQNTNQIKAKQIQNTNSSTRSSTSNFARCDLVHRMTERTAGYSSGGLKESSPSCCPTP